MLVIQLVGFCSLASVAPWLWAGKPHLIGGVFSIQIMILYSYLESRL